MEKLKIGIEILLIILGLYMVLFQSYFKKKGENIATKEDIGKITKEIEEIKNEFSFHNQKRTDLFFETKKNLIEFYDNFFLWVNDSMRISDIILSHHSNAVFLRESINNLKAIHSKVLTNYSRIMIYVNDKEFNAKITIIYGDTINNHNAISRLLIKLEDVSIRHKNLKKRVDFAQKDEDVDEIKKEFDNLISERDTAFEKFEIESKSLEKQLSENKKILVKAFKDKIKNEYGLTHNNGY